MNIVKVIEFLNHCEGGAKVSLDKQGRIRFAKKNESEKARRESIRQFEQIIRRWELFNGLSKQEKAAIIDNLEDYKSQNKSLTARKIRNVYRRVVEGHYHRVDLLSHIRWMSAQGSLEDRIILVKEPDQLDVKIENVWFASWRPSKVEENREIIRQYQSALVQKWGANRVARALARSHLDFEKMIERGDSLTVFHTRMMTMSLLDIHQADIDDTYGQITDFIQGRGNLTSFQRGVVGREFFVETEEQMRQSLKKRFSKPVAIDQLSEEKYSLLMAMTRPSHEEITTAFFGEPVEGIISGHQDDSYTQFWFNYSKDLQERLQLYEVMIKLNERIAPNQVDVAYDELLVKALAKKAIHEGMLIPAPNGEWYRVEKRIFTERSKLAYYLTPVNADSDLSDRLIYRSTASMPSAADSFTTVVSDTNPFEPPGYLWNKEGFEDELRVIQNSNRELKILGHSLGSSHAQILMINLMKHMNKTGVRLGNKKLSLVCFDSPAIKEKDAKKFRKWALASHDARNIRVDYYFSQEDIVPGAGDLHLGHGTHRTPVRVGYHMLSPINKDLPELQIHNHGRFYFLTRPGIDFEMKTGDARDLEKFDAQKWRESIEWARTASGIVIAPMFAISGIMKRVFIENTRHNPNPLIMNVIT